MRAHAHAVRLSGEMMKSRTFHAGSQRHTSKLLALDADAEAFLEEVFCRVDRDNSGDVTKHELEDVLCRLGDRDTAAELAKLLPDETAITQEQLAAAIFAPRKRNVRETFCLFLVMWLMPAAYSACMRLPFICLALEIIITRGGSLGQVGLLLGVYQACRVTANGCIGAYGGPEPFYRLYLSMVVLGLAGWLASLFFLDQGVIWLLLLGLVGVSEVVVCLQSGLINESNKDAASGSASPKQVAANLRTQYVAISAGSFTAYAAGGALYTAYGFRAICLFGVATQAIQILSFALYVLLVRFSAGGTSSHRSAYELLSGVAYQLKALRLLSEQTRDSDDSMGNSGELAAAKLMVAKNKEIIDALGQLYDNTIGVEVSLSLGRRVPKLARSSTASEMDLLAAVGQINIEADAQVAARNSSNTRTATGAKLEVAGRQIVALLDQDGDGQVSKNEFVRFLAPRVYHAMFGSAAMNVDIVWPYLKMVVVTQAVLALCVGSFLSTALLVYTQEFNVSATTAGLLLGVGEGLSALTIFLTSADAAKWGQDKNEPTAETGGLFQALFSRPLHMPLALLVVGTATMGFAVPQFAVAIVCQMVFSSVNDLSITLLNELTATSMPPAQFKAANASGQWLRRLSNVLTGVTGPTLFGVYPWLPFLLYGGIVVLWACFLWRALYLQAKAVVPSEQRSGSGPVSAFKPFAGSKPFHQYEREYYFTHRETLLRGRTSNGLAFESAYLEQMLGHMRAKLVLESSKRRTIEAELVELKAELREFKAAMAPLMEERQDSCAGSSC